MGLPTLEIKSAVTGKPVRTLIEEALAQYAGQWGQMTLAAQHLHISRQALYDRLEEYPDLRAGRRPRRAVPR